MLAEKQNRSNCYVCSYMPISSSHPNLEAKPFDLRSSRCIAEYCAPYNCITGTPVLSGVYWVCGHKLYLKLPPDWGGDCAPAQVTDHTYVVSASQSPRTKRRVFETPEHDHIWGSDVPAEHKLWRTSSKVILSLFPWFGVGKLFLRVETLNYRLELFINATQTLWQKNNAEVSAIRTLVLENRLCLDLLTASVGGACVLINSSCCSYIPDNTNSFEVTDALEQLRNLGAAMIKDDVVDDKPWNPFSWLMIGN
ncbi:LOW QUALITY PROTEIN: endogenous retrovirus group PABLB member 1 Env polyprotein-like, partial [Engraulis encrasicolus]|uniref:LOW QUALITY PROTEIN: endogenous retrovirus group PABLB member 1 Env polyprotein-like n=1 Tax=Engraulis encrasicolus TaxID=184585 RepID=UPI002FD64CC7